PYNIMDIAEKDKRIPTPRALLFESFRLKSFYNFPGRKPDYSKLTKGKAIIFEGVKPFYRTLAKRGFYYDRLSNEVRCYFCLSVLSKNDNYTEPVTHARDFGCKMSIYPLNGLARNYLRFEFPQDTHWNDFSNYEVRLSTYDPWFSYLPENQKPNKELFAKAGFVYTGISDIVMCFSCKRGLFNLDESDEPMKEHVRYYEGCSFARENLSGSRDDVARSIPLPLSISEIKLLFFHPLIKNLLFQGLETFIIHHWLIDYISCYGCFPIDVVSCLKDIEGKEEEEVD
ncbi:E3 ubiquitin-protein ligase XIAP, partial [Armadillidium nasatum]